MKIVVADNASVGKLWAIDVALSQYIVYKELSRVCLILFLKHLNVKFHCDMLFGQFQSKLRRKDISSIDGLPEGFESINKINRSSY